MLGFCSSFKVNEGINVKGRGTSIDIIVKRILGSRGKREADFEVRANHVSEQIHLKKYDPSVEVVKDVWITLGKKRDSSKRITVSYLLGHDYTYSVREYFQTPSIK